MTCPGNLPADNSLDDLEFRSTVDDGWYSVRVLVENDILIVKFRNFPEANDERFRAGDFETVADVDAFVKRFRPISQQLQDRECSRVSEGMSVCASFTFRVDDLRYYDAIVEAVQHVEHFSAKQEECSCNFVLCWLHGPNEGYLSSTSIANICLLQPTAEIDSRVASFLKMAKIKSDSSLISGSIFVGNDSTLENGTINSSPNKCSRLFQHGLQVEEEARQLLSSAGRKEDVGRISKCHKNNGQDIDFGGLPSIRGPDNNHFIFVNWKKDLPSPSIDEFVHKQNSNKYSTLAQHGLQVKEEVRQFLSSAGREEDTERISKCHENNLQGIDFGGLSGSGEHDSHHYILIENLEKDLSSSSIVEFIHKQTSISPQAYQAYVFPSLSSELYTRGVIEIDCKKKFKKIYEFLDNPDHIVTSSMGRPWVITEEPSRCKSFGNTIQSTMPIFQGRNTVDKLKVIHRGAQEYMTAKRLRDLFLEFEEHQQRLHKRLALEEKKILMPLAATRNVSSSSHTR